MFGEREGAEIRISDKMQARLTGKDFFIEALTPEIQAVSGHQDTEWAWVVYANSGGSHQLHLTIDVILQVNAVETPRSISTFDRTITVEVPFGVRVRGFILGNWQWLWTALLIPVAAWLWKQKQSG